MKNSFIALVVMMASLFTRDAQSDVFTNPSTITFSTTTPGGVPGVSAPYPSTIDVVGLSGTISNLTVTLLDINHHRPDDIQVLLVGPTGAKYVLMADAGGTSFAATGVDLTFDDAAGSQLEDFGPLAPGTFQPTCVDFQNTINTDFSAPAPAGPYSVAAPRGSATLTSVFGGTDPNGTWSLYTVDDIANPTPVNTIAGGWSLDITTGAIQSTFTTLASSPNPSFTTAPNALVTFTATVTSNGVPVGSQGTVTFMEGAATLAGPTPLNVSGQASFLTSVLNEGSHVISAFYNGTASLNLSSGGTTHVVNSHTTVSSNQFWNLGLISIPDTGSPSTPTIYPSQIFVSGLTGTVSKVSVTLSNVAHTNPDDFKLLLVGPTGADLILLGNVGGSISLLGETLTLDDAAGSLLPDTGPLFTGTYRPSFVASSAAVFPTPAPVGPYNQPAPAGAATLASAFNGDDPNGTWSLYVVDDISGNGSGSIGAWGLEFTTSGDAATTTTVASSVNPSLAGDPVTFTAKVEKTSDNSAVTNGTVTFREGPTVLAGPVALDVAGTAAFTNNILSEGTHIISADYSGSAGSFNVSSGDITQTMDAVTVVSGTTFCNPAALQVVSGQTPGAYPSRILVTNLGADFCNISVTISNLSINTPDDVELLLVSPTGARFVLLSDAGGTTTPVFNTTPVFSDAAAGLVPDAGPMLSGTVLPTDVSSTPASFPAPAPAPPYMHPAPTGGATLSGTFGGVDPNGYWSLYVVDDVLGAPAPNIANGWCLDFAYPPAATVGDPQSICSGSTTAGLGGNPPVSGTGAWSVESGGTGTFNPNASTPDATFTHTGGSGPITLRWTLTDGVCGADAADVEVTILAPPSVPAITATPANPYSGSGGNQAGGPAGLATYAWTISNGTITSATNLQTINYTAGGSGAVTLGLTVFNVSGCSASNSILVPITTPGPGDPLPGSYTADTTFTDGLGSTTMTLAFDGTNYWSCSGGSTTGQRLARYDSSGVLLSTYAPGFSFRSVFTRTDGTVLARVSSDPTIYQQASAGVFTNSGVSLVGGTLNSQSSVVFNGDKTEYIAMFGGVVSRWDLTGSHLGDVTLQGFGLVGGETDYPQSRGVAGVGAYWLTYSGNQILSIWDASGSRVAQVTLDGAGATFDSSFSFSYCNDKVWIVDGAGGTWRGYDIFAPVRVAVLAAESNASYREDVATQILATGDLFEVDIIPVQSGNPVPTLADLSRYRAVLVFSNPGFNDNVAMGDLLADYVDQGGVAVLATFTFWDSGGLGIQGRLKTGNYLPFTTASQSSGNGLTLIKELPQHPLLFDVASFDGGTSSYHNNSIAITNGATLVASWSNGQPLVGTRKAGPGGVVGLNFFPPSSDALGGGWDAATDGGRLMANALRWTGAHPPVILTHPVGDNVLAGVAVAFDVSVMGSAPLDLQWRKDGIDLPGQTGINLAFTAQVSSAGEYSLVASNLFGVATSSNATLTVTSSTNVTLAASDRGWYSDTGNHSPGSVNHFAGNSGSQYYHNWFVFDIPPLAGPIARAELLLHTYNVLSPTGIETYQLNEVTIPAATVQAGGSGLVSIYNDLGDGPVYAARTFATSEAYRDVSIVLNQTLRSAVAAAAGGSFVFGGEVASLDADIATSEGVFGSSSGGVLELILTVGTGDQPMAGYFTDNSPLQTGLEGPIQNGGFTPLHIGNIATQDLSGLRLLLINESSNSSISPGLASRLADIEAWVRAGGRLVVHDRIAGNLSPNPFLLGTPGLGTVRQTTSDLDLVEPASTLVTAGPFGILNDTSLDGGSFSAHGYVPTASLPFGTRAILSTALNQVACFSYPLGAGFVYYSTIPLDVYLGGGSALASTMTSIYTPNVISYTHELYAPLRFLTPGPAVGGTLPLFLAGADGNPISQIRVPQISVQSATDLTTPLTWTPLLNPMVLTNGLLRVDGLDATNFPSTFFRAAEVP